ncbi:MAG: flagellar basal body L-ring protein FlgH [Planctomycetota bacterium]
MRLRRLAIALIGALPIGAAAQPLQQQFNPAAVSIDDRGLDASGQSLVGFSMLVITPPPPREIQRHDLITIIVNQNSQTTRYQSLETEKEYEASARLAQFLRVAEFFEARLEPGDLETDDLLDIEAESEFEGEGTYERADRLTTRIQAEVIDVKPNGNLVLEARSRVQTDEEIQVMVLSGICRTDDVTLQNTIQSNELADLTITVRNEGQVRKSAKKGFIPRALEAVFAF